MTTATYRRRSPESVMMIALAVGLMAYAVGTVAYRLGERDAARMCVDSQAACQMILWKGDVQ